MIIRLANNMPRSTSKTSNVGGSDDHWWSDDLFLRIFHEFDILPDNAIPQRCKCHQMAVWSYWLIFTRQMELVIWSLLVISIFFLFMRVCAISISNSSSFFSSFWKAYNTHIWLCHLSSILWMPGRCYLCGLSAMRIFLFTSLFHISFLTSYQLCFLFILSSFPINITWFPDQSSSWEEINGFDVSIPACSERRRETGRDRGQSFFFLSPRRVHLPTSANTFCILCISPSCLVQCRLNWLWVLPH